jgi:lipoprotein-releasing system ATP-binding protein
MTTAKESDGGLVLAQHIRKSYPNGSETRDVLKDVTLSVARGQSLAIMGPSGSGKSTLLNIIGTLDQATSGNVSIFGVETTTLSPSQLAQFRSGTIGFVFQSHHLLSQCSIFENVLLPSLVAPPRNLSEKPEQRAKRLLERVGLTSRMHGRPGQLSGGECQRAAVVRALINAPQLLLADEPTGSLDQASAEKIGLLLSELKCEENVALIVVTHSQELASRMDDTKHLREGVLT